MKKVLIICALALAALGLKAQGRATTLEEYNYLTEGHVNLSLPGHVLRKSNTEVVLSFSDDRRDVAIWELYRDGSSAPCALLLIYRKLSDGYATYICLPDINSDPTMWTGYRSKLSSLNDTGSALETISYALGIYTASH